MSSAVVVPDLLSPREVGPWLAGHSREQLTPSVVKGALSFLPVLSGAKVLAKLAAADLLTPEVAAACVWREWCLSCGNQGLDKEGWRLLFAISGYTHNGKPATKPGLNQTLYRGSFPESRGNWSWTTDLNVACRYAMDRRAKVVYVADVAPSRLYAHITAARDAQYVVETDGLVIREFTGSEGTA